MNRGFWFVAGAGAGLYAMVKARRVPPRRSPPTGCATGWPGSGVGAQLFAEEVRAGPDREGNRVARPARADA